MIPEEFIIPTDPVQAAADIATNNWDSSNKAVLVCDGSSFTDEINIVVDGDFRQYLYVMEVALLMKLILLLTVILVFHHHLILTHIYLVNFQNLKVTPLFQCI